MRSAEPGLMALIGNFGNSINSLFADPVKVINGPTTQPKKKYKESQPYMQQYAGKNVIVTGATGDIGSKVARKLKKAGVSKLCLFVRNDETFDPKSKQAFSV